MAPLVGCLYHILPVYVIHFLTLKRLRPDFVVPQVNDDDIYGFDPSELPGRSEFQSDDQVWYFFCKRKNVPSKIPTSLVARAAGAGYWKSTGKGSDVKNKDGNKIGWKRNLVYHKRERGPPSKVIKTKWVMHEFYVDDSPLYKGNYVVCYIEKQPNKQPSVSTPGDSQLSSSLSSESVNHNIEGKFTEVESLQLRSHFLISDTANPVTENTFTEVAPQPISSENLVSDSRNHVADNTSPVEEPQQIPSQNLGSYPGNQVAENTFSTVMKSMPHDSFQHQPMVDPQLPLDQYLVSGSRNHGTENTFLLVKSSQPAEFGAVIGCNGLNQSSFSAPQMPINPEQEAPQVPSSHAMVFDSTNHAAENTIPMVKKSMPHGSFQHQPKVHLPSPSSQYLVSGLGNHVADYTCSMSGSSSRPEFGAFSVYNVKKKPRSSTKNEDRPAKKPRVLFNDEAQPSHNVTFNDEIRNRVVENTSPESQCDSISNGNHVAENISPELQPLPSCNSISDSGHYATETPEFVTQVDSLPPSAPDQTSFSALLSPMHPERGSSYSSDTNGDYNVLDCPLGFEWEDYFPNLPCTFQVECPGIGTGYSTPLYLNS